MSFINGLLLLWCIHTHTQRQHSLGVYNLDFLKCLLHYKIKSGVLHSLVRSHPMANNLSLTADKSETNIFTWYLTWERISCWDSYYLFWFRVLKCSAEMYSVSPLQSPVKTSPRLSFSKAHKYQPGAMNLAHHSSLFHWKINQQHPMRSWIRTQSAVSKRLAPHINQHLHTVLSN